MVLYNEYHLNVDKEMYDEGSRQGMIITLFLRCCK